MKAWKSGAWSIGGQVVNTVVNLGVMVILGRLLTPEEFGLFGLVLAVMAFIMPVLDMGLQPAYIKMANVEGDTSNAFFTVNVLVGSLIVGLLIVLSPWLADFYQAAELSSLIAVFAISILLSAGSGQPNAVLRRDKRFDRLIKARLTAIISGAVLVIYLAWSGYGVWSLVWRAVLESAVNFCLLVYLSGKWYRLVGFARIKAYQKDLLYGIEIVFSRILSGWASALDKLVLGKFVALGDLGGYTRAQQIGLMPDANIRTSITTPAFSYLARRTWEDKFDDYMTLFGLVFLLVGTPCLVLSVFGDCLLPLYLGGQWFDYGWLLQWMGLFGLARVFQGMTIVYHLDRKVIKRSNKYELGAMIVVLMMPVAALILTGSMFYFVAGISMLSVFYWSSALFFTLRKDWPDAGAKLKTWFAKMAAVVIITSVVTAVLRAAVPPISPGQVISIGNLGFGIIVQITMILLLFAVLNPNITRRLKKHVMS